jgi:hypothetical protein
MDPLIKRGDKTPAFPDPAGAITMAEHDANLQAIEDAVNALETGKLDVDAAEVVTATKPSPVDADQLLMFDSAAAGAPVLVTKAQLLAGVGDGGGTTTPLGLWDFWYQFRVGNNGLPASDYFAAAPISSGTNTNFPPNASNFGYNSHGLLLRSSTTANGGYRYQASNGGDYFGATSRKFRGQITSVGSFTGRTIRVGFHNSGTSADAADGAYFEIVDGVASCKTSENSVRTTDATTYAMALDVAYTLDVDIPAGGASKRFRIYAGTSSTAVLDVTITDSTLTTGTRRTNVGIVATESSTTASDICILHSLGIGTVEGFVRAVG